MSFFDSDIDIVKHLYNEGATVTSAALIVGVPYLEAMKILSPLKMKGKTDFLKLPIQAVSRLVLGESLDSIIEELMEDHGTSAVARILGVGTSFIKNRGFEFKRCRREYSKAVWDKFKLLLKEGATLQSAAKVTGIAVSAAQMHIDNGVIEMPNDIKWHRMNFNNFPKGVMARIMNGERVKDIAEEYCTKYGNDRAIKALGITSRMATQFGMLFITKRDNGIIWDYPTMTLDELGDKYGMTRERARQILNKYNVPKRPRLSRPREKKPISPEVIKLNAEIIRDFHAGGNAASISEEHRCTPDYVRDLVNANGFDYGGTINKRRAIRIASEIAPMIEDYKSGMYVREVAEKYGLLQVTLAMRFRRAGITMRSRQDRRRKDDSK